MRATVTGAGGFVGSAVVRRLLADGATVTAVVRPSGSLRNLDGLDVEIVSADLRDPEGGADAVAATRPDVCFHLAAAGAVAFDPDHSRLVSVNALGPLALARALARSGCGRLVTAGSSSEYGPSAAPMTESRAAQPMDVYGATKLAGGLLAAAVGRELGLETVHLRLFSVYGPREDGRRLVASVARALAERRPVALTGGAQVRDFVFVDDVADAFAAAAVGPDISGSTLNIGSGRETTVREMCLLLAEASGAPAQLLEFGALPYRPNEVFSWRADTTLARRKLGWEARTTPREGARLTVEALEAAAFARARGVVEPGS